MSILRAFRRLGDRLRRWLHIPARGPPRDDWFAAWYIIDTQGVWGYTAPAIGEEVSATFEYRDGSTRTVSWIVRTMDDER